MSIYQTPLPALTIIETSHETVPQMFILIVSATVSLLLPDTTPLGLMKDESTWTIIFFACSIFKSYWSVIGSMVTSMDIKKKRQLKLTKKIVLRIAFSFQLIGRLYLLIYLALVAMPQNDLDLPSYGAALTIDSASCLLAIPIALHWIILSIYYVFVAAPVFQQLSRWQKFLHILSNRA